MVNFEKPKTTTRVGVENQEKIPSVMKKYEPSVLMDYGLPIPVTWVRKDQRKTSKKEATESNNDLFPLPGLSIEPWSAIEHASFLLGIYVFEKNFRLVKDFIGSKQRMRSIISYYYREFHKSGDHDRWSKWRKDRSKRPNYARKLFTGWSHQELLSRLSSNVTDECKDRLIQDGTLYIEGRLSLTGFLFNLKQNVGMNLLVEAVAIGQEGRDLLEYRQISDWSYVSVEVPTSSTHTPQEILEILNSGVRLSKSRSSELFWNAIWPRLLARGWQSVLPRNNILQNTKNFVFLVPGAIEFSRYELKKGIHYFDSLSDVLGKVASEPELLELKSNENELVDLDKNQDPNNEKHQDNYLEPDVTQSNQDLKMFTIVDVSSDHNHDGVINLMELPSLPVSEPACIVEQRPHEQDLNNNNSENHLDLESSERCNESKPVDDTEENNGFEVKTPSGNDKHEKMVEESCAKRKLDQENIIIDMNFSQMAPLRQSTRSRMLSTKALEALAFGYLSPKKKRKRAEENPSRRVRGKNAQVSVVVQGMLRT